MPTSPEELLSRLAAGMREALGDELLSLSVHGSWVAGDFQPGRSDLDLLAVLAQNPDAGTLARLMALHEAIAAGSPEWEGHVEVDYVSRAAVDAVLAGADREHAMLRISPGEPLHLVPADRHYVLNWRAALDHDHVIAGRSPREVLPPIPDDLVRRVVIEHARQWPAWLADAPSPGFQAYAVLTMCRVLALLRTGRQWSKHQAALSQQELMPDWRELIRWADDWWYGNGSDTAAHRLGEVTVFVRTASQLASESYGQDG